MADTLSNISVTAETWINVYSATGIDAATSISMQNTGVTDLYYSISEDQPERNTNKYRIFKRSQIVAFNDNDFAVWIFSPQVNGLINIELMPLSISGLLLSIIDILSEISANNNDQNCTILSELKLSNIRFEEAFDTKIKMSDI